jgi:hypothetical protein
MVITDNPELVYLPGFFPEVLQSVTLWGLKKLKIHLQFAQAFVNPFV